MEPLRGLAEQLPGDVVTIHAVQALRFPKAIWKAAVPNGDAVYDASLGEDVPVTFLARCESTTLLKYVLRHTTGDFHYGFELIYEETHFTNTSAGTPWIANLCFGTSG